MPVPETRRKRVLVIDDDEVILKTASLKLGAAGYEVITASDASEAISAVGESRPDIVLLDINFPADPSSGGLVAWDGFRLMNWLEGLHNADGTGFIVISGDGSTESRERAIGQGAVAFFAKPLDYGRLLEAMKKYLEGRSKLP